MLGAGDRRQKEPTAKGEVRGPRPSTEACSAWRVFWTVSGPVFRQLAYLLSRVFTAV